MEPLDQDFNLTSCIYANRIPAGNMYNWKYETINYIEIRNLNRAQEAFKNYEAMLEKMSWADRHARHFAFSNVLEYLRT